MLSEFSSNKLSTVSSGTAFLDKKKATYFANYRYPNYLLKRWGLVSLLDLYPAGSYSLLRGQ